jgi:homoserine kinase
MSALERYQSRIAVLSGLFETFYDEAMPEHEAMRLFGRMMDAIHKLTQQGFTLVLLCPQTPMLTRMSRRCLDETRGRADRAIRVEEAQGLVTLHDEGEKTGKRWEFPRTFLDLS